MKYRYMYLYLALDRGQCNTLLAKVLKTENYLCAIRQLDGKITDEKYKKSDRLFLCSDICQESFVNDTKIPVLCEIERNQNGSIINDFTNVSWLHVMRPNVSCVKLYILDEQGVSVSLESGTLRCTLVLAYDTTKGERQ